MELGAQIVLSYPSVPLWCVNPLWTYTRGLSLCVYWIILVQRFLSNHIFSSVILITKWNTFFVIFSSCNKKIGLNTVDTMYNTVFYICEWFFSILFLSFSDSAYSLILCIHNKMRIYVWWDGRILSGRMNNSTHTLTQTQKKMIYDFWFDMLRQDLAFEFTHSFAHSLASTLILRVDWNVVRHHNKKNNVKTALAHTQTFYYRILVQCAHIRARSDLWWVANNNNRNDGVKWRLFEINSI